MFARGSTLLIATLLVVPALWQALVVGNLDLTTAMVRYLVLPKRPDGTENYSEPELAALVTRDTMIGVVPASIPSERTGP